MARDPYKYFRVEARELLEGLTQGVLQLERGPAAPEVAARLLRLAHTLKGAARVVKEAGIAEAAHQIEDTLTDQRDAGGALTRADGSKLLGLLDGVTARLLALEPADEAAPVREAAPAGPVRPPAEEPLATFRVEIQEMDALLRGVNEAGVQLGAVRKGLAAADRLRDLAGLLRDQLGGRPGETAASSAQMVGRARALAEELRADLEHFHRGLAVDVERAEGEFAELRDVAHRLRLVPTHSVFPSLERVVRDAAHGLGRRVEFAADGGEVRLDVNVLASLRDALMHVVRNAVVHGGETEAERAARGKLPVGQVRLTVERRHNLVAFACSDDGRGIDVEAVRSAAVARGRITAAAARSMATADVLALLRTGGLTTASAVTELAGRGIGMDVVRATTARLRGALDIRSEPGRGTTIEIQVPVSIASLEGLVVEAGGTLAAIPLDAVRQTRRVLAADISRARERDSILYQGNVIPFAPLGGLLRRPGEAGRDRAAWLAVVVQAGTRSVAVGVDRLLGTSSIVLHALPGAVAADPVIAGASLDAEGNPQLVLDPNGLVAAAESRRGVAAPEARPRRAPVLIVDDSLTTRMLEQAILESAGYQVELAVSAEDALTRTGEGRHSLFLVDVEMPGMDGFEFAARTRADAQLRATPIILVTSRDAPEDRRRGAEVGACAYIVKGEFDQGLLLHTIRGLIG